MLDTLFDPDLIDRRISSLQGAKAGWAATNFETRAKLVEEIAKTSFMAAEGWANSGIKGKGIPEGSALGGEEWTAGPYAMISYCNKLAPRLRQIAKGKALEGFTLRDVPGGRIAARVLPASGMEKIILSGMSADVWMTPDVTRENLADHVASAFRNPPEPKVCVVLGAGNVSSIAPLDCLHKLFFQNEVVLLKLNPVNAYLKPHLEVALGPLIERNLLAIVDGGAEAGDYICNHAGIESLFITGSQKVHDIIVWGAGDEGAKNKAAGTPRNPRPIESELGGVGPTIVVPGPWSAADITYQAQHITSQKLTNEGHICVSCQVLVMPEIWDQTDALLGAVKEAMQKTSPRPAYYPGAKDRTAAFTGKTGDDGIRNLIEYRPENAGFFETDEVFAPVLTATRLQGDNPEAFLKEAITYANDRLYGTLGANIIIHPKTMRDIGHERFEQLIADLRYGTIAINTWAGIGFGVANAVWGAFPGHTLDNAQSGMGKVHNAMMFDSTERTVLRAPFRQSPLPPWFVTHRNGLAVGKALTRFEATKSPLALVKLMLAAIKA